MYQNHDISDKLKEKEHQFPAPEYTDASTQLSRWQFLLLAQTNLPMCALKLWLAYWLLIQFVSSPGSIFCCLMNLHRLVRSSAAGNRKENSGFEFISPCVRELWWLIAEVHSWAYVPYRWGPVAFSPRSCDSLPAPSLTTHWKGWEAGEPSALPLWARMAGEETGRGVRMGNTYTEK